MSIHVCLISSARLYEAQYGGDSRFTNSLAKWLSIHRYPVTLIGSTFSGVRAKHINIETYYSELCASKSDLKTSVEKPKTINPPYFIYAASRLITSLKAIVKVVRIHRVNRISIIHAQDTGYSGLAAILAGKLLHLPVVISSHGIRHVVVASQNKGVINQLIAKLDYRLDLFCVRKSDGLIAANPFIEKYFKDLVPDASFRIRFLPIPISITRFRFTGQGRIKARDEFGISDHSILMGFVGRFAGVKNLISLLEAFAEITSELPTIYLLMVGAGTQERELKELARKRGVQTKVIFAGLRSDVDRVLSALDIFVLPSFTEGLSTSLLEAMAASRAIICSDIPANTLLIRNGENGITVNPNNRDELKEAVLRLASDAQLRSRMGSLAAQTAIKYDEENVFPVIERYYKQALENFRKR
jgi:glycosyltransferase involved in cell wall biosynthesis